ncbi:hypothetical protein LENED_012006 [Lentinula edodes]|uniref:Uncharacterized protein n=1 Tax=Lentinula edodes TaxID=5353 RepID=A0A1Q3ERH7_LENED|nr:hypothetical protein LENED_012006 [Lentinula edodes]
MGVIMVGCIEVRSANERFKVWDTPALHLEDNTTIPTATPPTTNMGMTVAMCSLEMEIRHEQCHDDKIWHRA